MFERTTQGAVDVIQGESPLNADCVQDVDTLLQECLAGGQPQVVFDLGGVPLIDGAGLELLLDYRDRFAQLGGALKLAAPNPLCREIFLVSGIGGSFEVFREALSAVGSFVR